MTERLAAAQEMLQEAQESERSVLRNISSIQLLLGAGKAHLAIEEARTSVELAQLEYEEALQESA